MTLNLFVRTRCIRPLLQTLAVTGVLLLLPLTGCGYGDVSPVGYEYSKALYSITNRQAADKLANVSEQINMASQKNELGKDEAKWLRSIIAKAESGDWKAANQECRELMEAQIK